MWKIARLLGELYLWPKNRDGYFQQEEALRAKCESGAEIGQSRVFGRGLNDQECRGATLGSWWRDIAIFQYNKMEKTK